MLYFILIPHLNKQVFLCSHLFHQFFILFFFVDDFMFLSCFKSLCSGMNFLHILGLQFLKLRVKHMFVSFLVHICLNCPLRSFTALTHFMKLLLNFLRVISFPTPHAQPVFSPSFFKSLKLFIHRIISNTKLLSLLLLRFFKIKVILIFGFFRLHFKPINLSFKLFVFFPKPTSTFFN